MKKLDEVTETVTDAIQRSCKANDWQTASSLLAQLLDGETRGMYYVYIWQAMNQGMTINMFLDLVLVAE